MPQRVLTFFWICVFCGAVAAAPPHWAFEPVRASPPPSLGGSGQTQGTIDSFIAAKLAGQGLTMSPAADPRTLARRAWFDLVGLPPTPEDLERFIADNTPDAWERLIDELLARPQYGERWGRHWLDIVRFGETNGYERDGNKPEAWRYRDYVIRAFNEDKPYDRFVVEQLAGDELPGFDRDAIIATGFYRLHVWDDEPDSTLQAEYDDLDDIIVTTSGAFLGLTLGCARCHDHKFDPVSQKDYYQFLAFLRSINPHGLHHKGGGGRGLGRITRPLAPPAEVAEWENNRQERIAEATRRLEAVQVPEEKDRLSKELERIKSIPPPFEFALAVTQDGDPKPTHVLVRGQPGATSEEVQPAFPGLVGAWSAEPTAQLDTTSSSAGRRLALAHWITDPRNPLPARVLVNRLWQHHFGRGIVPSSSDFGHTGEAPTHPELLDYLAEELVRGGWSIKRMHRLIMTSHAYRMSSHAAQPEALRGDQANTLFWRQNPRRLEGEIIRDSMLAFAGRLNLHMGGPGVYPEVVEEVHRTQDSARKGWGQSPRDQRDRRSVYIFVKRALPYPLLEAFDLNTTASPLPQRPVTTVAPQALLLLNDGFVHSAAGGLANRLRNERDPAARVERAFLIVLQRPPTPQERGRALQFLADQQHLRDAAPDSPDALTQFCLALLNLNETVYVD